MHSATTLTLLLSATIAALVIGAPLSSSNFSEYIYQYEANIVTINEINSPVGFKFKAKAHFELMYEASPQSETAKKKNEDQDGGGQLYRLRLTEPSFYPFIEAEKRYSTVPLTISARNEQVYNQAHDLYAHVITLANGTAYVEQVYTHSQDSTTFLNLKKSILLNLLPSNHHLRSIKTQSHQQNQEFNEVMSNTDHIDESIGEHSVAFDGNTRQQPELFSPDSSSQVKISAKLITSQPSSTLSSLSSSSSSSSSPSTSANEITLDDVNRPKLFQTIDGYQNVTFKSRLFGEARSNLTTTFHLSLLEHKTSNSHKAFDDVKSLPKVIELLNKNKKVYIADSIEMRRERKVCSQHHCNMSLKKLFESYKEDLTDELLASVEATIAQLRLLDAIRGSQTTPKDIAIILKKSRPDILSSFLDILAAARTKDSIELALKHLKLPTNSKIDVAERFLSVLSVSAKTSAKMRLDRQTMSPYYYTPTSALKLDGAALKSRSQVAGNQFIAEKLLDILSKKEPKVWASTKLRWSTFLALATITNARNIETQMFDTSELLNKKVNLLLLEELNLCKKADIDCRIVLIQAIGNLGLLDETNFNMLKENVLNASGRESISSMKVLRDLLQNYALGQHLSLSFYSNLKELLIRVVYDHLHETTSRILAAEMIVRFIPDSLASKQLLGHLPSFGNTELATMIYSRVASLQPKEMRSTQHENWYWKSCIINGSSASFIRTMAKTDSLNASYGVNVELLNQGKLLKESSFDVFLDTDERTQDLFSLGIFTRGMQSFAGGSSSGDSGNEEESESALTGMSLKLLGGYLRPYIFFNGMSDLLSHVWHGTASEPTTVFNGNMLLIDHDEGYPLISGFVAEQQMRAVLSIDVDGSIQISMWNRNSHSNVRTKASVIVHASQSVFTSYDNFYNAHLFSFGGEALVDFVADTDFHSTPFKICLQVTQPEFKVR